MAFETFVRARSREGGWEREVGRERERDYRLLSRVRLTRPRHLHEEPVVYSRLRRVSRRDSPRYRYRQVRWIKTGRCGCFRVVFQVFFVFVLFLFYRCDYHRSCFPSSSAQDTVSLRPGAD